LARVVSHNIVGVLPGTDKAADSILYGAHWDAYGENTFDPPGDRIRNGAVDNGTGTATVLEIARAFTKGQRPRRSVVFALWTAEEKGLLGASWYAIIPFCRWRRRRRNSTLIPTLSSAAPVTWN
jgi:Zn-dependent M28 family amino/carboxypeptidase